MEFATILWNEIIWAGSNILRKLAFAPEPKILNSYIVANILRLPQLQNFSYIIKEHWSWLLFFEVTGAGSNNQRMLEFASLPTNFRLSNFSGLPQSKEFLSIFKELWSWLLYFKIIGACSNILIFTICSNTEEICCLLTLRDYLFPFLNYTGIILWGRYWPKTLNKQTNMFNIYLT